MDLIEANRELTEVHKEIAEASNGKEDALQIAVVSKKEAEEAEALKEKKQKQPDRLNACVKDFERNVYVYDESEKWQLLEPDFWTSSKAFRDKKALPLVNKLKSIIKNLTLQLLNAVRANEQLQLRFLMSNQKVDRLRDHVSYLEERNDILAERAQILDQVEHAIGKDQVSRVAGEQRRREENKRNQRKRHRGKREWLL